MPQAPLATWMLEREARALLARLARVQPFAVQETMLPAAALSPAAQTGIELYLIGGRRVLRRSIIAYIRWLRGPGGAALPQEQQRRFTYLRLRFNLALSQLDLFSDAITQRSENSVGLWLSGLDVAAQDALDVPGGYVRCPPVVCYLHRGLGGAIRRARTRLPGGGENPVAIIRIPRERMIGYGIASSLFHEVGHQAAALLGLVESLRISIQHEQRNRAGADLAAWRLWERWVSEIVADAWSIGRVGVSSTMGLIGLVSLPRAFVFRMNVDDPHPFSWIRVQLSCAIGDALYPNPQWRQLAAVWTSFYPTAKLRREQKALIRSLLATMPAFVRLLLGHRPAALGGRSIAEVIRTPDRAPERLLSLYRAWRTDPRTMRRTRPALAFAVVGQARAAGLLTPEDEDRILGRLIGYWALDSTLKANARLAAMSGPTEPATTYLVPAGASFAVRSHRRPVPRPRPPRRPPSRTHGMRRARAAPVRRGPSRRGALTARR